MIEKKVPSIIIGLGGVGSSIAGMINQWLSEEEKQSIYCFGMDINSYDLDRQDVRRVNIGKNFDRKRIMEAHPEYKRWTPPILYNNLSQGYCSDFPQYRATVRLAALDTLEHGGFRDFDEALIHLYTDAMADGTDSINVWLCGTIAGITGSTLIFTVSNHIRNVINLNGWDERNVIIRGVFMGADIMNEVASSAMNREKQIVNSYAAMKELNAFYMNQGIFESESILRLDDEDRMDERLYQNSLCANNHAKIYLDSIYLFEKKNRNHRKDDESLDQKKMQIAKFVYAKLLPISNLPSIEDATFFLNLEYGGLNRYSGFGICSLTYPYELHIRYAQERWMNELLQEMMQNEANTRLIDILREYVQIKDERIHQLETMFEREPLSSEIIISGTPLAFRTTYRELHAKLYASDSLEMRQSILDTLQKQISEVVKKLESKDEDNVRHTAYGNEKSYSMHAMDEKTYKIKKELIQFLDTDLSQMLKQNIESMGRGILDMNIRQAIQREFLLDRGISYTGVVCDEESMKKDLADYERSLIENAFHLAEPTLEVKERSTFNEKVWMAIHPDAAEQRKNQPDARATLDYLIPEKNEATDQKPVDIRMHTSISPYSILCVKEKHKYRIEDLVKY